MIAALNSHHNRRHRRRQRGTDDSGFTLIELLVVIIILGVLAAVVVFAVNGVGDKGLSSARAIDVRTISTAQEAFNAKFGRYASMDELVSEQFLSAPSKYHETYTVPEGTPDSAGNGGNSDTSQGGYVVTCEAATTGCGEGGALKLGWQQQTNPVSGGLLEDVMFIDHLQGWAVGGAGLILRTTDGGATWVQQASGFTGVGFRDVDFVDADYGWAVGQGVEPVLGFQDVILSTVDGGATWVRQTNPVAGTLQLDGMDFSDRNNGWVGGRQGLILRTTNGGGLWTVEQPMVVGNQGVRTLHFPDATHGWAGAGAGFIYRYDSVSSTWSTVMTPPISQPAITGVKFIDALRGWAVGVGGNAFRTTDGGLSWGHTHNFGNAPAGLQIASNRTAVDFVNERQGWTVGGRFGGVNGPGAVLTTVDGGATWQDTSLAGMSSPFGVDFLDAVHGWAVGSGGTIYRYGPLP